MHYAFCAWLTLPQTSPVFTALLLEPFFGTTDVYELIFSYLYIVSLISGFNSVGQNIYLQKISKKVPGIPFKAVKKWFDEIKYFKKSQISPFKFSSPTGHFTQVVWASTSEVKFKYL